MADLSPSDTAFEGFRLTREQPQALAVWTGFSLVVSLVSLGLMLSSGLAKAMMLAEQGNNDPTATFDALMKGGPAYFLMLAFGLVVQGVMMSAVFRAVLRPEDKRYGYLRLGMDELRQIVLFLILVLILMVAIFLIVLVGGIVSALVHGLLSSLGSGGVALGVLAGFAIGIGMAGLAVYVVVRLSLAPPMTFAAGRLRVRHAWKMTKGAFWRLLGSYFLAMVMFVVVLVLALVVVAGIGGILGLVLGYGMEGVGSIFHPDLSSLKAYMTIPTIVYTVFSAALTAVYYAVVFAPPAVAYQALSVNHPELLADD
jgi:hypothetical protein